MNPQNKPGRGGKREGAGRKPAPYQTETIAFRVRSEWINDIKQLVKSRIKELEKPDSNILKSQPK